MDPPILAEARVFLREPHRTVPVTVRISHPVEHPTGDWEVQTSVVAGRQRHRGSGHGGDALQAILNALIDAAVEVNQLRSRGALMCPERPDDYFCLDELLRTPATNGYLPTGIDRPAEGAGQA